MTLYVWSLKNDVFERVGVIDNATSIIWVKRFNDVGEFEIYIKATTELLHMLQGDIFITRDDSNVGMYVEKIQLTTDAENGNYLTISGRSAECILGWRYVTFNTYTGAAMTAEKIIRSAIDDKLIYYPIIINPGAIPWLSLGPLNGWEDYVNRQFTGKSLLDITKDICQTYNYGFEFEWTGSGFQINLYKGTDRSFDQTDNPLVVFSPQFENLGNTEYITDTTNYANSAWIGGEGEGTERKFVYVFSEDITGFARREIYVDARNSSSNNGEISENSYRKLLAEQAKGKLEERKITRSFNGEILNYNAYTYGVDYELGDKVSVVNEYGIRGNTTITEITEVEDENGFRIVPTLSEWTIIDYEEE